MSSRVTLWFDVVNSPRTLSGTERTRFVPLENRIGKDGVMRVISQQTRSQVENKELAIERFIELLREALRQVPIRKKTRVSKRAKERRLEEKKQHSMQKQERSKRVPVEDIGNRKMLKRDLSFVCIIVIKLHYYFPLIGN